MMIEGVYHRLQQSKGTMAGRHMYRQIRFRPVHVLGEDNATVPAGRMDAMAARHSIIASRKQLKWLYRIYRDGG